MKIKISMICEYKKCEIKIKRLQLKMNFLVHFNMEIVI